MILRLLTFCGVLLYSCTNVEGQSEADPIVETKVGVIRGVAATDGDYSMFMGIPYGRVDENNPFGPSIPVTQLDGIFDANDDTGMCPQVEEFNSTIAGTLDCLHINVYVPNTASSENRLPVLLWIYGGAFRAGSAGRYVYGPSFLVRHDIILVTVNYRIGPYGFMCLDIPRVPGNQGLKDQLMGMRWVRDNIESFGGDPNKVTLFGESAGGMCVDLHLHYDQEQLFDKILIQSGSSNVPGTVIEPDKEMPFNLAQQLGLITNDVDEALDYLATIEPGLVIAAAQEINTWYRPCVEKDFENVEKYVTDYPVNMEPNIRNISIMTGFNEFEKLPVYAIRGPEYFENLDVIRQYMTVYFDFTDQQIEETTNNIHHFYLGDNPIHIDAMWEIIDFDSHMYNAYPMVRSIGKYLRNGGTNIYLNYFTYDGDRNWFKNLLNITVPGAAHCDETGYLFDVSYMTDIPTEEDQYIIDAMTTMWANFVKYGDPTPEITDLLPVKWPSVTADTIYALEIDSELKVWKRPLHTEFAFWDLFYKENERFEKGYRERNNS